MRGARQRRRGTATPLVTGAALAFVVLAGCAPREDAGPDVPRPPESHRAAELADAVAAAPPRAARPVPGAARADVESLLHSWIAAGGPGHGDARSRIAREIVALGGAGMDVVLAWLISGTDAESDAAAEILPGFGAAAIAPLVARLDDADAHVRERAAMGIRWFGPLLRDPALGASVCRVLVARFRDPAMRLLTDYEWRKTMDLSLRVHAAELAAVWAAGDGDASDDAGRALVLLGSDAAPALPAAVEILRRGDPDRRGLALLVLSACAGADAEQFADVASLLDSDDPGVRRAVAPLIPRWGEVPDDVVQRLAALLDDVQESDGNTVRTGALSAFAQLPGAAAAHLSAIVAATAAEDTGWDDELPSAVDRLCADPTCRAALVRLLPTLAGSGRTIVAAALRESATLDERLADADPEGRAFALDEFEESKAAPSPSVLALLDDPDAAVRAQAVRIVAYRNGASAERIRAVAIPLLANENMTTRGDAMAALAALSPEDGDAFARVLSALTGEDAGLAAAAMAGLAIRDAPIPGDHAAEVNSIERRLTDCTPRSNRWEWDDARAVLRFDGGSQALVRAAAAQLSRFKEWRNTFAAEFSLHCSRVLAAIVDAGPAGASLHAALQDLSRTEDWDSRTFADALAATASDADEIATLASIEPATARRLVAIGPAGLAALPLLVQRADEATRDPLLAALTGLRLDEVVVAAARVTDDAPSAIVLREGAAVLARLVAPERAVPLLVELAASPYQDVRVAAIRSLISVETRHAGAVPIEDVAHILSTAKFDARGWALRLAGRPGPRGAPLVPALQRIRADAEGSWDDRLLAGAALRSITGDAEEVLVVVRAALTITDLHLFLGDDWEDDDEPTVLGDLAQTIDWSGPRRELLLRVFACAGMSKVQRELLPVISRLGPDAAPFVPALRFALSDSEHTMNFSIGSGVQPSGPGEPILRTLASIGAAARVAIPDIRRWMAVTTDPNKVARDAIATIQSAPR